MLACLGVSEPFCQTKINHIDVVLLLSNSNQEIVRFDVSMKKVAGMDKLNSLEHLVGEHEDGFEAELALAIV